MYTWSRSQGNKDILCHFPSKIFASYVKKKTVGLFKLFLLDVYILYNYERQLITETMLSNRISVSKP